MLSRFLKLLPFLQKLLDFEFQDSLLDEIATASIRTMYCKLKDLESIALKLQKMNTTLYEARALLDSINAKHPNMRNTLSQNTSTIKNKYFESSTTKIIGKQKSMFSFQEKRPV